MGNNGRWNRLLVTANLRKSSHSLTSSKRSYRLVVSERVRLTALPVRFCSGSRSWHAQCTAASVCQATGVAPTRALGQARLPHGCSQRPWRGGSVVLLAWERPTADGHVHMPCRVSRANSWAAVRAGLPADPAALSAHSPSPARSFASVGQLPQFLQLLCLATRFTDALVPGQRR